MKNRFNNTGQQTYASRQEELEAYAKKIDDLLQTPKAPGHHFTPKGEMRKNGTQYAHDVLDQKRIDIKAELKQIHEQMVRRQVLEKEKVQGKSL